jgi:hypothetical protein
MTEPERKLSPAEFLAQLTRQQPASSAAGAEAGPEEDLNLDFSDLDQAEAADDQPDENDASVGEDEADDHPDEQPASHAESNGAPASDPEAVRQHPQLSDLFDRVNVLLGGMRHDPTQPFRPIAPETLEETRLTSEEVERLILKFLLSKGSALGRVISNQIKLPFHIVDPILKELKQEQLVAFKGTGQMGDYDYQITDFGRERARRYADECTYFGAAPVTLHDYLKAMEAQSIAKQEATEEDLRKAFADLIINDSMFERLGPAINSGRGMFLFGEPGNGKTSIAERITRAFGSTIWIPRALGIDGDIIRLFDPGIHEVVEEADAGGIFDLSGIDQRWVQVVRPTIIAGGELTMQELEVVQNPSTKICESPLQLKSNCGTLVIDDFGRQKMSTDQLLNRWIVPLEKRYDFLNLPNGKKIQVPFDQLIIFSTNLEPKDLVDGAFLRRIPYKIEVPDPTEEEFRKLCELIAPKMGFQYDKEAVDYLIEKHYKEANRPFRACQPRDLLLQVRNFCVYKREPKKLSPQAFDFAVENYFSVM